MEKDSEKILKDEKILKISLISLINTFLLAPLPPKTLEILTGKTQIILLNV